MDEKLRYCLYADPSWVKQAYGLNPSLQTPIHHDKLPRVMASGLLNWARIFDGDYHVPETLDQYRDYDVIHINVPTSGIGRMHRIREAINMLPEDERPLLVANPDYAVQMWEGFQRFDLFLSQINLADRIFCVHPVMSDNLKALLGRKIFTIPHPTDINAIRKNFKKEEADADSPKIIVVFAHSYDQNYLIPSHILQKLKDHYPDVNLVLMGKVDKDKVFIDSLYDEHYYQLEFHDVMKILNKATVVIDTATTHSYGRVPVECAAVGVPCITDSRVYSGNMLWTSLNIDIFNGYELLGKLLTIIDGSDEIFTDRIPELALDDAYSHFGYDELKASFVNMLEDKEDNDE